MKNIDIAILAKKNELIKLFEDRDTLVKLFVNFGKEPENTIMKLTSIDILSVDDKNKFIMYNKGLVGINTKDTSISLAYSEIHKIIKSMGNTMLDIISDFSKLDPVNNVIDNSKVLNEYLDDVGVNNLLNAVNSDKALAEYASYKIHNIVSVIANPGASNTDCMNILYSISDTIKLLSNAVDAKATIMHNETMEPLAASIAIDTKHIFDNVDSSVDVVDKTVLVKDEFSINNGITTENINDYLTISEHELSNTTLIRAVENLYIVLKQAEIMVGNKIKELSITDYSNLLTAVKSTDKVINQYKDSEYTDKEFTKLYSEFSALTIKIMNGTNEVIDSAVANSNNLNRLVYVLYLTKAFIEKILVEATIK